MALMLAASWALGIALAAVEAIPSTAILTGGDILATYMNCAQPGPTPGCQYHPYANTVTPGNTTMNMSRQLQLSSGAADGDKSAAAFDAGSGVLYFFQGAEATMYRVDTVAHKVLAPVKLKKPDSIKVWHGIEAAYWDDTRAAVVAVARGSPHGMNQGGLVSINPSSGAISHLDSGVDPNSQANGDLGKGGGLSAFGAGLLVFPLVSTWNFLHSFQAINISTGVATRVKTTMDIVGLEYSDGSFWALGVDLLGGAGQSEPGQPLIAKLDPDSGAFTMVANLTELVGKNSPLHEGWGIMTGESHWRAVSTFDHANGIMYFACDPNLVGVSVRTGHVTTSSPLVHWADGTQDAEFVSAMQFLAH